MTDLTLAPVATRDPWAPGFSRDFGAYIRDQGSLGTDALKRTERAARETGERFDLVLTRLGLVSEADLARLSAGYLGLPLVTAADFPERALVVPNLEPEFLRRRVCLPVAEDGASLLVAVADPFQDDTAAALSFHLGRSVRIAIATPAEITRAIERLYGEAGERPPLSGLAESDDAGDEDIRRLTDMASEAPVVRLVHETIQRAIEADASDIHFEATETGLHVRQRIDGELDTATVLPAQSAAAIISRLKIMARLNIAERRLPQDGRIRSTVRGRDVELRVSTMPTLKGESVVLRILDRGKIALDFDALGFSGPLLEQFLGLLEKPNGLILVTGPTGSGKSTTLYAALSRLNQPSRKMFTIEDPVETQLAGVSQVQVQPRIGLTFANALRSILRQDPNIIMVGEIRDLETAQMAMQSALTGHLVLSTLHTNSAPATVARLLDMGVEDYLIASTLKGALAQRLVRRLCEQCARPSKPSAALRACVDQLSASHPRLTFDLGNVREPVGCPHCRSTGYRGRLAIAELLVIDDRVAEALVGKGGETAIAAAAATTGMRPMLADGLAKVAAGATTLDEVLRVARGI